MSNKKNEKPKSKSEERRLAALGASQAEKPEDLNEEEEAEDEQGVSEDTKQETPVKRGAFNAATASMKEIITALEGPGIKLEPIAAGSKAAIMARNLAGQPKIRTIIRLEGKERRGVAFETAILNGLRFNILKGMFVNVPEQVAELFEAAQNDTAAAIEGSRIGNNQGGLGIRSDRDGDVDDALTK